MNRLDEIIVNTATTLDCLRLLRDIEKSGNCNSCSVKNHCRFLPEYGERVRYNCPFYNGKTWPLTESSEV